MPHAASEGSDQIYLIFNQPHKLKTGFTDATLDELFSAFVS